MPIYKLIPCCAGCKWIRWYLIVRQKRSIRLSESLDNLIENAIRGIAVGRKNFLFAGSHEGASRAAMLYSFLGSCKKQGVDPFFWLRHVLEVIPAWPANKLYQLLPTYKAEQNKKDLALLVNMG